jgi:pimeloyl-ACP methyl ester carboxylesterase
MRRSAPSASGWSHPVFLRRFGSGGQLGVLFAQRAHGGSFAALFLLLFTLSLQRGDLRRQFARRFSSFFSAALAAALRSAFCFRRALIVLSVLF